MKIFSYLFPIFHLQRKKVEVRDEKSEKQKVERKREKEEGRGRKKRNIAYRNGIFCDANTSLSDVSMLASEQVNGRTDEPADDRKHGRKKQSREIIHRR